MSLARPRLSVAICTFNRAASLERTLDSLAAATPPPAPWELLVVDNNSTDATRAVAQAFMARLPLRYVFEPVQGLSAARNRALATFSGEWLLFTDDDVRVDGGWLNAYARAFAAFPAAAFFGGRVVPAWPDAPPRWLGERPLALLDGLLVWYDRGAQTRLLAPDEPLPYGASFALSRAAIDGQSGFRRDLGVVGSEPGRGEESEFMQRLRAGGEAGVYVGEALAHHMTDTRRLRLGYLYRYGVQKGVAERRFGSTARGSLLRAASYLARGLLQGLRGRGDRLRQCVINAGIEAGLRRE